MSWLSTITITEAMISYTNEMKRISFHRYIYTKIFEMILIFAPPSPMSHVGFTFFSNTLFKLKELSLDVMSHICLLRKLFPQ